MLVVYGALSGSTKDNRGIFVSYDGGYTWSQFALGDYFCAIDSCQVVFNTTWYVYCTLL